MAATNIGFSFSKSIANQSGCFYAISIPSIQKPYALISLDMSFFPQFDSDASSAFSASIGFGRISNIYGFVSDPLFLMLKLNNTEEDFYYNMYGNIYSGTTKQPDEILRQTSLTMGQNLIYRNHRISKYIWFNPDEYLTVFISNLHRTITGNAYVTGVVYT
jgi:hypothetical protein